MLLLATSFLFSFLLLSSVYPQPAATIRLHDNHTDLESLLAFKSHVVDPLGILATNWTTSTPFCHWFGVSCSEPRHQRVTALDLRGTLLHGTISPHLGNLTCVSHLYLRNCSLTGPIPDTLARLPRLSILTLARNLLSGTVPNSIFNMPSLTLFSVAFNNLSGSLAPNNSSMVLPRLKSISVSYNQLIGEIPPSFGSCKNLQIFSLSANKFTGNIPSELGHLPKLTLLYLGANQLSGPIPSTFGNLTNLSNLDLGSNNLTGPILNELGNLLNLQYLNLGENDLNGSIPNSLLNASNITTLAIDSNSIVGPIPTAIGASMPLLKRLYLFGNHLIGGVDFITSLSNCRALQILDFSNNEIEGVLPVSVGNLSVQMQYIAADTNNIRNNIPSEVSNLTGLTYLDLYGNELTGPIPRELGKLKSLQVLYIGSNSLSGHVPHEFGQLKSLTILGIYDNRLSGPIPDSVGNLTELQNLIFYGNWFSSRIPQSLWNLKSLLYIDLSYNFLKGTLPSDMSKLETLYYFDLRNNQLSGNISSALGALQMLSYLDFSNNSFDGLIPESLGDIVNIEYMNLSHNFLSGTIPKSLASLRHLNSLDLSFNHLEGKIPEDGVFLNLTIPLLQGNKALCGAQRLGFAPCPERMRTSTSTRRMKLLKCIIFPVASALALLACFYFLPKFLRIKEEKTQSPSDTQWPTNFIPISYNELARATENFSEDNLLGRGSCSSVFKACLDNGMLTAVKVINSAVEGASKSFEVECEALSKVRHRNIVKIISTCSNLEFKSMIIQFMQNGNLDKWLYCNDFYLNLLQRLQIMMDVALALEHLHHHHTHVIIHCDVKPSNVLLDENMVAHVGDFGIAKLFCGDSKVTLSTIAPGTIGYMAPEYGLTGKVSRKGDIYSFGILLLETFTRKKPTDAMFNEELNLREWVRRAHPARIMEIVDCRILEDDCVYEGNTKDLEGIHQCLSSIMELGLLCSIDSAKERISMKDVVSKLRKIKLKHLASLGNT